MAQSRARSVFLDSNVIFSGVHSPSGPPARILRLCVAGRLRVTVSQTILEEVIANVRNKLPGRSADLLAFLSNSGIAVVADPPHSVVEEIARFVNWDDAPVVAAALTSDVDYFVTGDRRLVRELQTMPTSIPTCSPRELIEALDADTPE